LVISEALLEKIALFIIVFVCIKSLELVLDDCFEIIDIVLVEEKR